MRQFFVSIFRFFEKHPKLYWIGLFLSLGLSGFVAAQIHFEQNINKMIPRNPAIETMNKVLTQTQTGEQVIFTLSFKDSSRLNPDSLIKLQVDLQKQIQKAAGDYIKSFKSQISPENEQQLISSLLQYLPLFLTEADYKEIGRLIQPERIQQTLEKEHKMLLSPAGMITAQWIAKDPIGITGLAFKKFKTLQLNADYELYDNHIFNHDKKQLNFFLVVKYPSSETGKNKILFQDVDRVLTSWQQQNPEINISYFGSPAVAAGNATQMQQDTLLTLSITILLLLLLIGYVFRRKRAPFLLMIPVVFGGIFGLAITTLVQGSISIIAIGAGAIILGIALDFSAHFMSHARSHPDMEDNVRTLVFPLTLGAFTTIAAFYALRFAHAPVLQDLGLFAAASLLGASLFTLIFLPHLLKNISNNKGKPITPNFIDHLAIFRPEGNKYLLIIVVIATPILWYFAHQVKFDGDLMHLNYLSPKLQKAQTQLDEDNSFALSAMFVVAKGQSEEAAAKKMTKVEPLINQLKKEDKIRQRQNPLTILPSKATQKKRIVHWNNYWTPARKKGVIALVNQKATALGFSNQAFDDFSETLNRKYKIFDSQTTRYLKSLMPNAYSDKDGAHFLVATLKVTPGQRASVLKSFADYDGVIVTDRQSVSEALLAALSRDFNIIFYISGFLVFLTLLIAYGRIELALISFLPMVITWIWILGLMALLGLEFNVVNIVISTLIFGLGDDYCIFMMDGLLEKYKTGKDRIAASRSAVYLSVLTTIIGLGTLIFAQHPALKSISLIAILGLVCVVFVSQIIQPFLFNILIQNRADKGFMPFTLWSLLKSSFSFFYFSLCCLVMTIIGFVLIRLNPFGRERSKYLFHFLLSKGTRSVMYVMTNVRKKVIKPSPDIFKDPAIYIANHSSFLDILLTTMLHPKLVLLTNKWVWQSPVFGKVVRMAQYYPVADGAEESVAPLRKLVQKGYGIIVFPEGSRSNDDTIHRFHKGAFFLAEKLNLNIVPVILHGVHYTMQKGDWLLKNGTITVKILDPIKITGTSFGIGYSEKTKLILRWFRVQFEEVKNKRETPKYFREQIFQSHIYKGPILEWYCKIKVNLEDSYEPFHQLLPKTGFFYDLGCGYGFMTYMLHWAAQGRRFEGIDYDEEKIETAKNNYTLNAPGKLKDKSVDFSYADLTNVTLKSCNGIIISDVLHYLLPERQNELLEKCYDVLMEDGILIIRDGVSNLQKRHRGTKWTELFSTRIFKFNKTKNKLYFLNQSYFESWAKSHNLQLEILDYSKKTSNLIFILRKHKSITL